jgi:hypothetical protein
MEILFLRDEITEEQLLEYYENNAEGGLAGLPAPPVLQATKWGYRGWKAFRIRKAAAALPKIEQSVIKEIKRLPDDAIMTVNQAAHLSRNLDALLTESLPELVKRGSAENLIRVLKTDARFRFLDQIPGGRQRIIDAFRKYGLVYE